MHIKQYTITHHNTDTQKYAKLETVSIPEPLQNRQHTQNPYTAVNSREWEQVWRKGDREGRKEG